MRRVFVDMDGVLVDFDRYMAENGLTADEVKRRPGAYAEMVAMEGAITGIVLLASFLDVWIATKPPTGVPHAYADKVSWVLEHLPWLSRKIIITHDKGLLGNQYDILVDDRWHKANCEAFSGHKIRFGGNVGWKQVVDQCRSICSRVNFKAGQLIGSET